MGIVLRLLGRLLFVGLFIGAAIDKVQSPEKSAAYLNVQYQKFHTWIQNTEVFKQATAAIPPAANEYLAYVKEYSSPSFVQDNSKQIITYVGYTQLGASALVILGLPLAGWVLYLFTLSTIVIIHNPFSNPQQFHSEFMNAVLNLAIAGIALFIASDIRPECSQKQENIKEAKKVQATTSKKPSQAVTVTKTSEKKRK